MKSDQSQKKWRDNPAGQSTRQLQKEATRRRIIRAARACFLSSGVAKPSFDDIAARAEVSRATVYLYYSSKEQLLLGMLEEDWEAQCALYRMLPSGALSEQDLAQWLRQVIAGYGKRRDSMGLYALVLAEGSGMADRVDAQRDLLISILGERFAAFAITAETPTAKRVEAYMMLVQIEHICLMAIRDAWADKIEAGIELVSRRLAAFVAAG